MKKLLLLLFLIPNLVMGEESYYPKSCKPLPVGTEIVLKKGFTNYEADAIKKGLKDELKYLFESYLDTHFGCYGDNCIGNLNFKGKFRSFSYDLNDDGVDEVFTEFDTPGNCGSAGCPLYLIQKINDKWTIGLEDKIMNMFAYSSTRIVITDEKINDYKVIYLRHRDYGVNEPGECPYSSGKCTYDKKIQTYKCSGY